MLKHYMASMADEVVAREGEPGEVVRVPSGETASYGKTFQLTKRWENKRIDRTADAGLLTESELNALGADGWELAGMVSDHAGAHFYLKRQRGG